MKLQELLFAAGIECPAAMIDTEITDVTCDSRRVKKGSLFVCLPGSKTDGTLYASAAMAAGAAAVLYHTKQPGQNLFTNDTMAAMPRLCRKMYGDGIEKLKIVAVTGTNGKTTVVRLLDSIFTAAGKRTATIGTLGNGIGVDEFNMTTPDPERLYPALSELAGRGTEYVFLEASSHALAQKKLDALEFDAGIFTNITRDHFDYHGNFENYLAAKSRLAPLCKRFIVNSDDKYADAVSLGGVLTCSERDPDASFTASETVFFPLGGFSYRLGSLRYTFPVRSYMSGDYNVMNSLEAAACALTLGIDPRSVCYGILSTLGVPGRMEKVALSADAGVRVYIDYAHTPDALEKLLINARRLAGLGRVILVFGCGGDRDRGKRKEMGAVATALADFTVVTSDNSRSESRSAIIAEVLKGINKERSYTVIEDREEAIRYAVRYSGFGDVIILAGKGHEKYEIDSSGKHDFDEAEIVRKAWLEK